jgi:hypothetical protein
VLATVGELRRVIGLLEGFRVEFVDPVGDVLAKDAELALEWAYVDPAPGRLSIARWRRERIPGPVKVKVFTSAGLRANKHATLLEVRKTWVPAQLAQALEPNASVTAIGDRRGRLTGPVWESARGTARSWQDGVVVADAFWQALEDRWTALPQGQLHSTFQPSADSGERTVSEQFAAFLTTRDWPSPGPLELEVAGSQLLDGRTCDLVDVTAGSEQVSFRLWVDDVRLALVRVTRLLEGRVVETVDFLDFDLDEPLPEGPASARG